MTRSEKIASDRLEMERGLDNPVMTISGKSIACCPGGLGDAPVLDDSGLSPRDDIAFRVRTAALTAAGVTLSDKMLVTYDGNSYRINEIRTYPHKAFVTLLCVGINNEI